MPIYAVTYDLNKDKDYQTLWDEFDRLKGQKAAQSFYLLSLTNDTSLSVRKHFEGFIDDDDTLIVVKTEIEDISTYKALKGTTPWIKSKS